MSIVSGVMDDSWRTAATQTREASQPTLHISFHSSSVSPSIPSEVYYELLGERVCQFYAELLLRPAGKVKPPPILMQNTVMEFENMKVWEYDSMRLLILS